MQNKLDDKDLALIMAYVDGELDPSQKTSVEKLIASNPSAKAAFEDLKLSIRDRKLKEKVFAIEAVEVDVDAWILLEYLKNEYTQVEILDELDKFIERTVATKVK